MTTNENASSAPGEPTLEEQKQWKRHELRFNIFSALLLLLIAGVLFGTLGESMHSGQDDTQRPALTAKARPPASHSPATPHATRH